MATEIKTNDDFDDDFFDTLLNDIIEDEKPKDVEKVPDPVSIETVTSEQEQVEQIDQVSNVTAITDELLQMTREDRTQATQVFDMLFEKVNKGRDIGDASKEFLVESLKVKVMASKNLIDLLKTMKQAKESGVGVFVNNGINALNEGINFDRIKSDI